MRKISLLIIPFIMYTNGLYASSRNNGNNHRNNQARRTRSYIRGARNYDYDTQHAVVNNNPRDISSISRYPWINSILFTLEYHEEMLPSDFPRSVFMSYEQFSLVIPAPQGGTGAFGTVLNDNIISAISNNDSQFMSPIIVNIDRSDSRRPMLNVLMRMMNSRIITEENRQVIRGIANYFVRYGRRDVITTYSEYFRMGVREEEHNNTNNRPVPAEINTNNNIIATAATNPTDEHTEEEEEISPLFRLIMSIGGSNS